MGWNRMVWSRGIPFCLLLAAVGCSGTDGVSAEDPAQASATRGALVAPPGVEPELARSPIYQGYLAHLRSQRQATTPGATPGPPPTTDTLTSYAAKCDAATGIHVPAFNCDLGTEVPEGSAVDTLESNALIGITSGSRTPSGSGQTIVAAGADIYGTADQFFYGYQTMTQPGGLQTAEVKVTGLTNTNATAKAGIMIRDGAAANAINVMLAITPASGAVFQSRSTTGGTTSATFLAGVHLPIYLRLSRENNNFSGYVSTDRVTWTQVGSTLTNTNFTSVGRIGLGVTSHNASAATTATFDRYSSNKSCDEPNVLNQACDPGSRFQVLVQTPDAAAVAHCRRNGKAPLGSSVYNDIAVIQYNKSNGAVCFYQALGNLDGAHATAPSDGNGTGKFPWLDPSPTHGIRCTGCHDSGGFIRSEYLAQLSTPPNVLPNQPDGFNNYGSVLNYVGIDFAADRSWRVNVLSGDGVGGSPCNTCHQLSVNNRLAFNLPHSSYPTGTRANFANVATAASQATKTPHSAASAIWMRPGQVTYQVGAEQSASAYQSCALGYWGLQDVGGSVTTTMQDGDPVCNTTDPRTANCKFTPLGTAFVPPISTLTYAAIATTGSHSEADPVQTLSGSGAGILGTSDQIYFAYLPMAGDGTAIVKVNNLVNTDPFAKAGLMSRESTAANATNVLLAITPTSGATMTDRLTSGGTTASAVVAGKSVPLWLRLVRAGNTFTGSGSSDLVTWTQVGAPVTFASFAATPLLGLAITSHNGSTTTTADFESFAWTPASGNTWADVAIGASVGSRSEKKTETISSSGGDIYANADQFFFSFRNLTGDGTAVGKVLSQVNTDPYAKAGLMFRDGSSTAALNAFVGITPSGPTFQNRPTPGAATTVTNVTGGAVPIWLRLVRSGTTFTGAVSNDGVAWTQVGGPMTFASFGATPMVGLAVSSHTTSTTTTAVFDSFSWTPASSSTWVDTNVGTTVGSRTETGTVEAVSSSGGDIFGNAEQFYYAFKTLAGDGTATVKVTGQVNTDPYAKAGRMLRDGSATNAVNAFVGITPSGTTFQSRTTVV